MARPLVLTATLLLLARPAWSAAPPSVGDPAVNSLGGDVFDPPYRKGAWLPLVGRALAGDVRADVVVKGADGVERTRTAVLDTGCEVTLLSSELARELGIPLSEASLVAKILDANGTISPAHRVTLPYLKVGDRTFTDLDVRVVESEHPIFLVGFDVLAAFDIVLAPDIGYIGLYPAGRAPVVAGSVRIPLRRERAGLRTPAYAKNRQDEEIHFDLLVDTGATDTQIPVRLGLDGKLPTWVRPQAELTSVGGTEVQRGRFSLDPLYLGTQGHPVYRIRAASDAGHRGPRVGLLGNDVLLGHRTVIRPSTPALFLAPIPLRPATRMRGPGGTSCKDVSGTSVPCLSVSLDRARDEGAAGDAPDGDHGASGRHCLRVDAHPAFGGRSLELGILARWRDGRPALNPKGYLVYLTVGPDGDEACFPLGTDGVISGEKPTLSIVRVRARDIDWPCDPESTHCVMRRGALD